MRVIVMLIAVSFAGQAFADAHSDIKYRQGVMMSVGGHMEAMVAILKGGVHKQDFQYHARSMAELAKIVPDIFPAGSGDGKTDALPAIWKKPDAFHKAVEKFVSAADDLNKVDGSGDMGKIGPAINALGHACKGCHEDFRKEHRH